MAPGKGLRWVLLCEVPALLSPRPLLSSCWRGDSTLVVVRAIDARAGEMGNGVSVLVQIIAGGEAAHQQPGWQTRILACFRASKQTYPLPQILRSTYVHT